MARPVAEQSSDLISVADASARLQVSPAQVHNLCRDGVLTKVPPPAGRKHHPPRAGVITRESIERLLRERSGGSAPVESLSAVDPVQDRAVSRDQAMAHEFKVRLDSARAELRVQRNQTRAVLKLLKGAIELLDGSLASEDAVDDLAEGYSKALTSALTDDDVTALDPAAQPETDSVHWSWG